MILKDYKSEDIEEVVELKGMASKQLESIERCLQTDSIDEATVRAFHLIHQLGKIRKIKHKKTD